MDTGALFTCSIDDGHPSDMRAADLLARHGLRATFYLPLRNREGPPVLSPAQMRELSTSFEIGSHTLDHCFLRNLDDDEARRQVVEGKNRLENLLGRPVAGFCYPGGKYRAHHVDLVKDAGFRYARTTMNLRFDAGSRAYELPTTMQFYPHSRDVYLRNVLRGGDRLQRLPGLALALRHRDWIVRLHALLDHATKTGGVFHLWCHTKDIDDLDAWRQFDRFLAHVASRIPADHRLDNRQLALHAARRSAAAEPDQRAPSGAGVK